MQQNCLLLCIIGSCSIYKPKRYMNSSTLPRCYLHEILAYILKNVTQKLLYECVQLFLMPNVTGKLDVRIWDLAVNVKIVFKFSYHHFQVRIFSQFIKTMSFLNNAATSLKSLVKFIVYILLSQERFSYHVR